MKKKILLIDDNPMDNSNFISVLQNEHDVYVTAYIDTARVRLSQPNRYDLVVIDIMMPTLGDFSGIETNDGLKTGLVYYEVELKGKGMPVLFWSWNEDFKKDVEASNWEKTDFLFKDTEDDHLLKGVNEFCKKFNI